MTSFQTLEQNNFFIVFLDPKYNTFQIIPSRHNFKKFAIQFVKKGYFVMLLLWYVTYKGSFIAIKYIVRILSSRKDFLISASLSLSL